MGLPLALIPVKFFGQAAVEFNHRNVRLARLTFNTFSPGDAFTREM